MFEEKLAQALGNKNEIKLVSAVYQNNDDCLSVVLSYPDGVVLSKEEKERIKTIAAQIIGTGAGVKETKVQLKKRYIDQDLVKKEIDAYIKNNFPMLYALLKEQIDISSNDTIININLTVSEDIKDYVEDKNVLAIIQKEMQKKLSKNVLVNIFYKEETEEIDTFEPEIVPVEETEERFIKVYNKSSFVGQEITDNPLCIEDVKTPSDSLTICGVINRYAFKEYTKDGKTRYLAKFFVKDPTGELEVIKFVPESQKAKMEKLQDGIEVLVRGSCEENKFSGLELKCKDIMLCEIQKNFSNKPKFKSEPKTYTKVFPKKIEYNKQLTLFDGPQTTTPYLENNDVVVFDLETTGLNFLESEIIEIGAIKIKKGGYISEKFSCFVKPSKAIPQEITDLTGITNEDVKDGVNIASAIADFFKFTRGCTLVGHNVSFDYGFINYYGLKVGYDFSTNPQHDTYALAQKYLPGLKNYKLKTVADHFGVSLKNAHRAYNDAYATAEVFMKLTEFFK